MKLAKRSMMHCIVAFAVVLGGAAVTPADEVTTVAGSVTWLAPGAVEVDGRRGLITSETSITSEGRAISVAGIQVGMPAEMEVGPAGQALELRVKGAVE